ncbi:Gfo/Idh/MocA family oxidoreductase, partial [bacterium]|nr:Gfo/Idh/MocA family oxidoreductase [bacterium]
MADRIRLGILGAARITKNSLIQPAKRVPEVEIAAIAARSKERAEKQARAFGIGTVHGDYESLLSDPRIDAVYIPLPNSLHCEWSIRAMEAGKHVLCEKPIASNADEAARMADIAQSKGVLIAEAMHSRYHAFPDRIAEILKSGVLGNISYA